MTWPRSRQTRGYLSSSHAAKMPESQAQGPPTSVCAAGRLRPVPGHDVLPPLWVFPQRARTSIVGSSAQPRASAGVTAGTLGRASLQASMGVSKCQRSGAHRGGRKACCGLVDIGSVSHSANTNVGQGPKPRCLCSHLLLCDGRPQPTAEHCPAERSEQQRGEAESVPWLDSSQGVLETPAGLASSAGTRSWRRRWLWGLG